MALVQCATGITVLLGETGETRSTSEEENGDAAQYEHASGVPGENDMLARVGVWAKDGDAAALRLRGPHRGVVHDTAR